MRTLKFAYTMRAYRDICAICKGGKLSGLKDALTGDYGNQVENLAGFIAALANAAARRDGEELITVEDLLDLTPEEFAALEKQATDAFTAGRKREVESTPKKKNKVQPLR